ncbi:putative GDP-fucose protein O-fucosyltransferase [Lyophyllum shimeji]|uniref:GDP-fucose protein O-fucosyltransferase n=1 Tax=Lyophyllum shimeji TaxID=47721 RepID=A0A9P3URC9_LYOSH|nr:putative GDP-fucose protein O-fucosyltransferase [Lyophyllum shimeji]
MELWRGIARRLSDSPDRRHSEEDYELLPNESTRADGLPHVGTRRRRSRLQACVHFWTLRRILIFLALIPFLLAFGVLLSGIPPSYNDIREFERHLPQHNTTQALEEHTRYIRFPGHVWGHGLNNVLQEALLLHYLAFKSNRSYVFEDYVWSHLPFPYTIYDFALRPVRIPLNAFISGPTAGGPMEPNLAVSAEFWESVCPPDRRRIISSKDAPSHVQGSVIIDWWVARLKDVLDECVEIDSGEKVIFDFPFFTSDRIISLWDGISKSPVLADYLWSPLVHSAVLRNFPTLQPASAKALFDVSSNGTLEGLVAVHLRRGDYRRHCPRLAGWRSLYNGIAQHPDLPDKFDPSPYKFKSDAYNDYYMLHCLPTVEQLVERLRAVRKDRPRLRRVYVLTNAWGWWLNGLKAALQRDGWDDLKSSYDLELDSEQRYVAMAVDMAIAEKAEVFVGNGFSSLSSNIVMLRMAKGLHVSSNRFL